ncbi:MAG: sortase domain-bontaining protein, partial [Microcoleus sp.]
MKQPWSMTNALLSLVKKTSTELHNIVHIKRTAQYTRLVITLPLPRFKRLKKSRRQYSRRLARHRLALNQILTIALLITSAGGIVYSTAPLLFQPTTTALEQARSVPKIPIISVVKKPVGLARSIPTKLEIPGINLTTDLISLGKNPDGTLATPNRNDVAGWYDLSPTPGEIGPSILVGHVDNYLGPAVFFYLKTLLPGQLIAVTRTDGSV